MTKRRLVEIIAAELQEERSYSVQPQDQLLDYRPMQRPIEQFMGSIPVMPIYYDSVEAAQCWREANAALSDELDPISDSFAGMFQFRPEAK